MFLIKLTIHNIDAEYTPIKIYCKKKNKGYADPVSGWCSFWVGQQQTELSSGQYQWYSDIDHVYGTGWFYQSSVPDK